MRSLGQRLDKLAIRIDQVELGSKVGQDSRDVLYLSDDRTQAVDGVNARDGQQVGTVVDIGEVDVVFLHLGTENGSLDGTRHDQRDVDVTRHDYDSHDHT